MFIWIIHVLNSLKGSLINIILIYEWLWLCDWNQFLICNYLLKIEWIVVCKIFVTLYFKVFELQWIIKYLNCDIWNIKLFQ